METLTENSPTDLNEKLLSDLWTFQHFCSYSTCDGRDEVEPKVSLIYCCVYQWENIMSFTTVCKQGYCVDTTTTTTEVLHGPTHVFKQADAAGALTEPPAPSFL